MFKGDCLFVSMSVFKIECIMYVCVCVYVCMFVCLCIFVFDVS